jgi:hypothetical protein
VTDSWLEEIIAARGEKLDEIKLDDLLAEILPKGRSKFLFCFVLFCFFFFLVLTCFLQRQCHRKSKLSFWAASGNSSLRTLLCKQTPLSLSQSKLIDIFVCNKQQTKQKKAKEQILYFSPFSSALLSSFVKRGGSPVVVVIKGRDNERERQKTRNKRVGHMSAKRELHESCLDLLVIEMVERCFNQPTANADVDPAQLSLLKLEKLGVSVGHRLAERFSFLFFFICSENIALFLTHNFFCASDIRKRGLDFKNRSK